MQIESKLLQLMLLPSKYHFNSNLASPFTKKLCGLLAKLTWMRSDSHLCHNSHWESTCSQIQSVLMHDCIRYILQLKKILSAIWTNTFCNLDSHICHNSPWEPTFSWIQSVFMQDLNVIQRSTFIHVLQFEIILCNLDSHFQRNSPMGIYVAVLRSSKGCQFSCTM